jgi:Major capsid protein Gp23
MLTEATLNKWRAVLDHPDLAKIRDPHRRATTAILLENVENELRKGTTFSPQYLVETNGLSNDSVPPNFMGTSSSTAGSGGIDTFDPVLISLVRRSFPNLIAYDLCGVQPMTGPTGLIFALRVRQTSQSGAEQWYNEVDTSFSSLVSGANTLGLKNVGSLPGNTTQVSNLAATGLYNFAESMTTAQGEALGSAGNTAFAQMAFSIEKVTVTAGTRALAAGYTMELAQDLKAIHGLDAETELSNMLTAEILAEINREIIRTINVTAQQGSQTDTNTSGIFDLDIDSNGRWSVEKFKGLHFQIERECNQIAKNTRRGKGNIMLCSSDLASALVAAKVLDYTPAMSAELNVDDTGNTFAGVIGGRIKVYIDPYSSGGQYMTVGFKGPSPMDAGLFYCPYVPLQMVRAVDVDDFQPKIGFKTRYGVVANPFAQGLTKGSGALVADSNVYYRRTLVLHMM